VAHGTQISYREIPLGLAIRLPLRYTFCDCANRLALDCVVDLQFPTYTVNGDYKSQGYPVDYTSVQNFKCVNKIGVWFLDNIRLQQRPTREHWSYRTIPLGSYIPMTNTLTRRDTSYTIFHKERPPATREYLHFKPKLAWGSRLTDIYHSPFFSLPPQKPSHTRWNCG
jgi:hypothetical protein